MELIYSLKDIETAARQLWACSGPGKVVALHGAMGAGKTTLVHKLCEKLGVQEAVGSPTFSLINHYSSPVGAIYHIDLYRLSSLEEAQRAGVEEALFSGNTCFVEWPEKAEGLFPEDTLQVYLEPLEGEKRKMIIREHQ
jgi:tRNA threonylcarbamoyladenosine biosynthesis protein TsaE